MKLIKEIGAVICLWCITFSINAQNRVVTQHSVGTVVEGEVTMKHMYKGICLKLWTV